MAKLIYEKRWRGQKDWKEVSYDEALNTLLGSYKDNEITREMLTIPNFIPCGFSEIAVSEETEYGRMVSMPGLACLLPDERKE